jgi:hypothetical protein
MIELWEKSKHPREVVIGFVEHKEERAGGLRAPRLLGRAFDALGWLPRQQFLPQLSAFNCQWPLMELAPRHRSGHVAQHEPIATGRLGR